MEYLIIDYNFANGINPAFVDWLKIKNVILETLKQNS